METPAINSSQKPQTLDFWATHQLSANEVGSWKIGPLELWIKRYANEWRLYTRTQGSSAQKEMNIQIPYTDEIPPNLEVHRFGVDKTVDHLSFHPTLANRPVVVRPEKAFHLPPREEVTIFISHSVWLSLSYGTQQNTLMTIPVHRPSDTWFGPSSEEGELCYSARTKAKLRFEELDFFPYRAVTKIVLKNKSHRELFLERIKVPFQYLSLYVSKQQIFFTDTLVVTRVENDKQIKIEFEAPPKEEAGDCLLIHKPQKKDERTFLIKALANLVS